MLSLGTAKLPVLVLTGGRSTAETSVILDVSVWFLMLIRPEIIHYSSFWGFFCVCGLSSVVHREVFLFTAYLKPKFKLNIWDFLEGHTENVFDCIKNILITLKYPQASRRCS